jgi:hypothetical protein
MHKHDVIFAWTGSMMSILFLILVNYLTSSDYIWFIYPSFILLLWPISFYYIRKGEYKIHSIVSSLVIILFLITLNDLYSPGHPWFLYASYPVIWWPTLMILEKRRKTISVAISGSLTTIVYYIILNTTLSPNYPWAIYPSFIVLWWPLAMHYAKVKKFFHLSILASLITIVFFILVNMVSSPNNIWAVYPIFIILWWPLIMYYYKFKRKPIY